MKDFRIFGLIVLLSLSLLIGLGNCFTPSMAGNENFNATTFIYATPVNPFKQQAIFSSKLNSRTARSGSNLPNSCTTNDGASGTCMSRFNCMRLGGTVKGFCSTFGGICCETNLQCGLTSRQKRTIIRNPMMLPTADCSYEIEAYNTNVCQLLIEFEIFELLQPTLTDLDLDCTDYMQINEYKLCGSNSRQHLYIPFNGGNDISRVSLIFSIQSRWPRTNWRLIVTQLECPVVKRRMNLSFLPFVTDNSLQDARTMLSAHNSDLDLLAPTGCDQYFRKPMDTIRTFNYNENMNSYYMQDMKYVICIKASTGNTVIDYTVSRFSLSIENSGMVGFDNDCHSNIFTLDRREDYLQIPQGVVANTNLRPSYYCGTSVDGGTVISVEKSNDTNAEELNESDNEEYEEIEDNRMVEKTFKFEDFVKRLLNPKIVRACTIVLTDWEHIPTKSLKAAVTILHRIAYGCSCPAMLYQVKLFLIFQQVFNAARDAHHEELRRLGIYVVRKFVEIAPSNPKIYAELLFYKTIKEANELETGYCDVYESGTKGAWTEEQENELRLLFEENQRNPETDKDVIDWILENLIDKKRTRRGILKKLKELGLMFKAPTKKSTAAGGSKNMWKPEEDEELRSLYDMYRMEEDCLPRIMREFFDRRSKQEIIKRMLQLHMIADKSEILPTKHRKRKPKKHQQANSGGESDVVMGEDYMEEPNFGEITTANGPSTSKNQKPKNRKPSKPKLKKAPKSQKRKIIRTALDVGTIRALLEQIDSEKFQEAIDWLKDSLNDAADEEEAPTEEDDAIPLVPLTGVQRDAMEDANFKKLLVAMSIQPPIMGTETYWRVPIHLNSADLKIRVRILGGEEIDGDGVDDNATDDDNDDGVDVDSQSDDEDNDVDEIESVAKKSETEGEEDALDVFARQRQRLKTLVYNKSDEEDEIRKPLMKGKGKKIPKRKEKKSQSAKENDERDEEELMEIDELKRKLDKKKRYAQLSSDEDEDDVNVGVLVIGEFDEIAASATKANKKRNERNKQEQKQKQKQKQKEKEHGQHPPDNADALFNQLKAERNKKQKKLLAPLDTKTQVDDSDDDDMLNFNSEDYRKRLLELGDSDADEMEVEVNVDQNATAGNGVGGSVGEEEDKENTDKENTDKSKKTRTRRINIIDSDTDEDNDNDNDDSIVKKKSVKDDVVVNADDVDKTSNQAIDNIDGEQVGVHVTTAKATKKRRRSMNTTFDDADDDGDDVNDDKSGNKGAMNVASEPDTDAVLIKRKKFAIAQLDDNDADVGGVRKKTVKSRRLAIVDDDDDDDE